MAAFSGLLDDDAIGSVDWAGKKKKHSASSAAVYDIAEFDKFTTGSAAMQSPAPNAAYHLTAAKAKAPELLIDYEPLGPVKPISAAFKAKGKAPAKRKHDEIDDTDEEEMDDSSDSDGSGSGSQ